MAQLSTLGRFVILDMGNGLPVYVQKLLPMCTERIIVVEGVPGSIQHTRLLIDEIVNLKVDRKTINVVLNNRMRTEAQMQLNQVQEQLGHSVAATLTPAPEAFLQATRLQTPVVVGQPTNMTSQQFLKLADAVLEREKAR